MLRPLFASFFLSIWATPICQAQSADPFAILFGDDEATIDASRSNAPGQDDIELVRVQLRDFTLIETQPVFHTSAGICLPATELFRQLEAPVEVTETGAEGWFMSPERTLRIEVETGIAQIGSTVFDLTARATEEGWCLPLADWSKVLPIDFEFRQGTLSIRLTPREILPIEARLEREAFRQQMQPDLSASPDYPEIEEPYRWLSFPTADIDIDFQVGPGDEVGSEASIMLAGDVLKMTGQLHYYGADRPRISLGRMSEAAAQLGPLKARSFSIGDVVSSQLPLLTLARTGQGFTVSNRPTVSADIFDTTDIRGPLPYGWEAELYDGAQLLDFVTEADLNGDYVFSDVTLRSGYNRFTVKLFGPYGERDERIVKMMVGVDLSPENELQYSFGFVRPDTGGEDKRVSGASAYASLRYGLSDRTSAQVDMIVSETEAMSGLGASLSGTAFDTYGVVRIASNGAGTPVLAASAQKRLNDNGARLLFDVRDFGSQETEISGYGDARTQRSALLMHDTSADLGFGQGPVAVRSRLEWTRLQDMSEELLASTRLSGTLGRTRWTKAIRYRQSKAGADSSRSELFGDLLASRTFEDWRIRGALTYSAAERFDLKTLAIAGQRRFGKKDFGQLSLSYDMASSSSNLSANYSRHFDNFVLSANGGLDQTGNLSAGLRLSFSLFNDRTIGRYAIAPPGLSRTGAVRAFVYDDIDDNGAFSGADIALSDAGFILDQSLRAERTTDNGFAVLADVQPGSAANLELKQSSIEDPFLRPVRAGVSITPRPGRVIDVAFPLTATADIDGTLVIRKGDHDTPVSGVQIEAVSASGDIIATTKTEYDGYFYLDEIPARSITLRVAPSALAAISAKADPVKVALSREVPSVMGVNLFIVQ